MPKGTSFDNLTQKEVNTIASHINSTSRDSLNGNTPYEAIKLLTNEDVIKKLEIRKIEPKEVNLSPNLLKVGDK